MPRRATERIEFRPGDSDSVLQAMEEIERASDGWINILPGIDPDDAPPAPTGLSAILAPRVPGVVMSTWAPQTTNRSGPQGASVGIMHSAGRFAARKLAELGTPLPEGWMVRQDNPRRGLIVSAPVGASNQDVLDWVIAATTALCPIRITGDWLAQVYLPRPDPTR